MKTRTISFIFLSILGVLLAAKAWSQDGVTEKLFNETFPELNRSGMFAPDWNDLSKEQKNMYRELLQKLDDATDDLVAFEVGALRPENAKVFEYKKLKKVKKNLNTKDLKEIIRKNKVKIRNYMGFKSTDIADEQECKFNIAMLQRTTKAKKWKEAYPYWNKLFHHYPRASKTTYSKGTDIIEYKIKKDPANREKWIDTLMMVYDQRIKLKFFNENGKYTESYIHEIKAIDLLKYRKEAVDEAYAIFEKSIQLLGEKSEDVTLLAFMHATEGMFRAEKIDAVQVKDDYTKIMALLEKRYNANPNKYTKMAIDGVNAIFFASEASTCEHLIPVLEKRFVKNKGSLEELKKIAGMLDAKDCTDCDLFVKVITEIDKHEPSTQIPDIYEKFLSKEDYIERIKDLNEAIEHETVDSAKARYYFVLASYYAGHSKKEEAKAYALKAISLKPNFGKPYILIATLYASSGCTQLTSPAGELQGVSYWAAVDKLVEAKSVDPSVADAADKLIERYKSGFPNAEKAIHLLPPKGRTVKIGCWISETTKVRY